MLVGLGVRVLTAAGDDLTDSDDEFRVAMRQIMGVFSQLEKTRLVKKLKGRSRPEASQRQGRRPEIAPRGAAGGRGRGQAAASGQPENGRAAQPAQDRRRARNAWPPQRQWPALQRQVDPQHAGRSRAQAPTDSNQLTERSSLLVTVGAQRRLNLSRWPRLLSDQRGRSRKPHWPVCASRSHAPQCRVAEPRC